MNKSLNFVLHKKNISLKKYNNFKIEAKALNFYIPENINGFINLLKYFNDIKKKYIILGGGSNILFVDEIVEIPIIYTGFFSRIEIYSDGILGYSGAKIIDLIKWEQSNNIGFLNMTILSFVIDHRWESLQDIKEGKLNNVTFNVIESL